MAQDDKRGFWRRQLEDSVYFGGMFKKKETPGSAQLVTSDLTPQEQEITQTLLSKISEKLSLDERQKQTVLVAVSGVVHMATILFRMSPQPQLLNLANSTRFGAKVAELNAVLIPLVGEDQVRTIDEEVLKTVTEKLQPIAKEELPRPTNETRPHGFTAAVKEKGLIISDDQIAKAIDGAKAVANIQTNDDSLKTKFDSVLRSLVSARAASLRLHEDKAYQRAEEEFELRGQLLKVLNDINPSASEENEKVKMRAMIKAMDEAFGRKKTSLSA